MDIFINQKSNIKKSLKFGKRGDWSSTKTFLNLRDTIITYPKFTCGNNGNPQG
mgnify:CR=1 FL=1